MFDISDFDNSNYEQKYDKITNHKTTNKNI
jgi:hypothetical protein